MTRWNTEYPTTSAEAVTSSVKYNTAGSAVSRTTPWDGSSTRTVKIGYADAWNSSGNPTTYAYPTTITDPADNSSTVKYRYDIGANVEANSPAPAGNDYGKKSTRIYDSVGRIEKSSVWRYASTAWAEHAWTRYEYPSNGVESRVYNTFVDADGDGNIAEDEVLSETWRDGAGRVRLARVPHTFDTEGETETWAATVTEYDVLGRVRRQSVPTEVDGDFDPAGDDAVRGYLWNQQEYDWMGRVVRKINTDGDPEEENASDVFISYEGCGCAGGLVTTVEGELIKEHTFYGGNTLGRRKQKIYEDIQGRVYKTEQFNWTGSVYSTIKTAFNGRDHAVEIKHYQGADTSSTFQTTTTTHDGHGRVSSRRLPEYDANASEEWAYYPDDSISTITDPRGATTEFTYNSRGLVTLIEYGTPNSTTIPDTPNVAFEYDLAGNRTEMEDGTGTTTYGYDSLSQMISETKQFAGVTGSFTTSYGYHIGGGIRSVSVPGDSTRTVTYSSDKTGAMTGITGNSGTIMQNRKLRAFGGLKEEEYGNGFKMYQEFDSRLRIENYEVKNGSNQTVSNTTFEFNAAGQVTRANGQYYFDRYYEYDHVGRLKSNQTKWTGDTDHTAYYSGVEYDVWNNLTGRTFSSWGYAINSESTYTNNRNTWAWSDDAYSDVRVEYWVYDAGGNATWSGEQTHKYDAAGRKIESLEETPEREREELLIQQTYDGDGLVVKRYEHAEFASSSDQETTEYDLRSAVFGGEVIAKVTSAGVRGEDTVFDADGRRIARNGSEVKYLHETPFTSASFESTAASGSYQKEYEPFGGEIGTEPPPNTTPDWIIVGNYNQSGNPLDAQGGCLEDGFPAECAVVARLACFGNPRCMNTGNRVGGLGYVLSGFINKDKTPEGKVFNYSIFSAMHPSTQHRGDLPDWVKEIYRDKKLAKRLTDCINKVFGARTVTINGVTATGASHLTEQKIANAPYVDEVSFTRYMLAGALVDERAYGAVFGARSYESAKVNGWIPGEVYIANDIPESDTVAGQSFEQKLIKQKTYVHELGNILSKMLAGDGKYFGESGGVPMARSSDSRDYDTGAALEKCVYNTPALIP